MSLTEKADIVESYHMAMSKVRDLGTHVGILGYGIIQLFKDADIERPRELWKPDLVIPFTNYLTDVGDDYYAKKIITAISPANPSAPTAANGMKLGTGATALAKNGAGSYVATAGYISGSNNAFDATYPQTANLGAGLGVNAVYKTTWAAGDANSGGITEAEICNDQATDAGHSAATNTYARITFSSTPKLAADVLSITWNHKILGS